MNPIFNEYITFLRDTTNQSIPELKEGYFWLDRQIVKCFDKQGKIHKIMRIKIDNSLKQYICYPKGYEKVEEIEIASWNDTIELNKDNLIRLENESLSMITEKLEKYLDYTPLVPVSTGKDSQVTCYLVRQVNPDTKALFNNTTLDCADSYKMAKNYDNCETCTPDEGFYQYRKRANFVPTRFGRACCRIFKVGAMVKQLDHNKKYLMFMGMRNEESNTRSGYQDEWVNEKEWGNTSWQGILPIRKWTELDIWLYTFLRNIEINDKYKKGYSRVGCAIACPYYTKSTWVLDAYWYPTMRQRWVKILTDDFINNKKWIIMNCTLDEYVNIAWNGGTYRDEPTKEVIEEFAKYNGLDVGDTKVATQYFNKYCSECTTGEDKEGNPKPTRIKDKEVLAMNLKFHGREIEKFLCRKCFMKLYGMDENKWNYYVKAFKRDGCALFDKDDE